MAKHHPDLIMCRKQPGIAIGRLCEKCDGKCVICDSYVRYARISRPPSEHPCILDSMSSPFQRRFAKYIFNITGG